MRKVSQHHLDVAKQVASTIARDATFRGSLPPRHTGERAIIVASPNERMNTLFRRLEKTGYPVTVAVRGAGKRLSTVSIKEVTAAEARHVHQDDVIGLHGNITVKMMMDAVWEMGGSAIFHRQEPDLDREMDFELVASS